MALQSKELIFNQKPNKSVGLLVRAKRCLFSIHITMTNPNDTAKTVDVMI